MTPDIVVHRDGDTFHFHDWDGLLTFLKANRRPLKIVNRTVGLPHLSEVAA